MGKEQEFILAVRNLDVAFLYKVLQKGCKSSKSKHRSSSKRVNVNYQDGDGMSGLHQAALMGHTEIMELLLENGAAVTLKDNKGMIPLHYAAWQGKSEPVHLLLQWKSPSNEQAQGGETPLHLACQHGHFDVVNLLLIHHASPITVNKDKKTPLDLACEFGRYRVVDLLLRSNLCCPLLSDNGSDMTESKTTCLHLAAKNGHQDIISLAHQYSTRPGVASMLSDQVSHPCCLTGLYTVCWLLNPTFLELAMDSFKCKKWAKCMMSSEPGRVNCTCMVDKGYSGNGYTCIGNIFRTIKDNTNLTWIATIFNSFSQSDKELLLDRNYTVFVPHDGAFTAFVSSHFMNNTLDQWMKKDTLLTLINYHTLLNGFRLDMLVSLSYFGQLETMEDGYHLQLKRLKNNKTMLYPMVGGPAATVLQSDIICTNGYLNIIDKILMPYLPTSPDDYPDLETFFKLHPEYSIFGDWIMKKNLTDRLESNSSEYTLFVPTNSAMKHLKQTVTTEYLLYHIVNVKVMMASTSNGTLTTALGYRHQLDLKVYGWYNVTVNGVAIVDQDIFTYGGFVNGIDGLLHPVLHKCRETSQHVKYGSCGECGASWSCDNKYDPYLENNGNPQPCKYQVQGHGLHDDLGYKQKYVEVDGCQGLCYRNKTRNGCCAGYYGQTCAECPGGPELPCSGHGQCQDGIKGNGDCVCDMGWTGFNCDSCMEGWTGDSCDFDMKSCSYQNGGCDMDALCTMDRQHQISCNCLEGFTGDGYDCVGPCDQQNGGCHKRAICSFQVSTGVKCSCKSPFVGDGKTACNADIFSTLLTLHGVSSFIKSTRQLAGDDLSEELKNSSYSRKFTLFVPVDKGLPYPIPRMKQFQQQLVLGSVILRNDDFRVHNLTNMAGEQLIVTFNTNNSLFYVNNTYVIKGNIQCTNGIIHLMSGPFTSVTTATPLASKSSIGSGAIVGISVTAAFLVILLTVGAAVIWIKTSRSNYWQILHEWRSKQHRESLSQKEPLHVQEDKDDVTQSDTKFGNPLFLANHLE